MMKDLYINVFMYVEARTSIITAILTLLPLLAYYNIKADILNPGR